MTGGIARDFPERSTTMVRGFGRALDRATLAGGVAASASSALVSLAVGSTVSLAVGLIVGAVAGAAVGLVVARLLLPTRLLRAYEAFSWLGRAEMDRFTARTGSKVPVRRPDIERWLSENPPSPPMQVGRIELLAHIGRLDEARAELADLVGAGPDIAFDRVSLAQYIGWLSDGDARVDELREGFADLPLDEQYRHAADVTIAVAHARDRYMRADPAWFSSLERVRPSLGDAAARVIRRDTWRPLATMFLVIAFLAGVFVSLLAMLP